MLSASVTIAPRVKAGLWRRPRMTWRMPMARILARAGTPLPDRDGPESASRHRGGCGIRPRIGIVTGMSSRRIVVVVVPPVDELDLVGPLQVFNSVNRLGGAALVSSRVSSAL